MKFNQKVLGLVLIMLLTGLACNMPVSSVKTIFITATPNGTPNQTMTALFAPVEQASSTVESQPVAVSTTEAAPEQPLAGDQETEAAQLTAYAQSPTATTVLATATPEPTQTETPTVSPTGPTSTVTPPPTLTPGAAGASSGGTGYRSPIFPAVYLSQQPVLDGSMDDWPSEIYSMSNVTYGAGNWVGANDLSGTYRLGWDATYLYVAATIKDDIYAQNASGANLYMGDSLEVLLDTNLFGDFYYNRLSADDYQLGISPGRPDVNGTKEAYLWYPTTIAGSRSEVKIASIRTDGVTKIEAFIPWSVFNVTPAANKAFGFALSYSDNDNTNKNLQQTMISSSPNRHLTLPMTWGELILQK